MGDCIELGYISGVYGVNGWLKIYSYTRPAEDICKYNKFLTDDGTSIEFSKIQKKSKNIVGKIPSIDSRDQAEKIKGKILYVKRESLPKLKGEYYWIELVGLNVKNCDGKEIGIITKLIETGVNDVLVINNSEQVETLIPFVLDYYVMNIDLGNKQMIVDWEIE